LVLLLLWSPAACGGGESSQREPASPPPQSPVREQAAAPAAPQIDPAVQPTANEFRGRLGRNVQGNLLAMSTDSDTLTVRWSSSKCDYFEPEVIDLLISVHRTIKQSPTIIGARICEGQTRKFKIASSRFQLYRTGQLNDAQILNDTK
jgi:hypothetical protein